MLYCKVATGNLQVKPPSIATAHPNEPDHHHLAATGPDATAQEKNDIVVTQTPKVMSTPTQERIHDQSARPQQLLPKLLPPTSVCANLATNHNITIGTGVLMYHV